MKILAVLVLALAQACFLFVVNVTVLIYGWGLSPHSWPVIIGGFLIAACSIVVSSIVSAALKD